MRISDWSSDVCSSDLPCAERKGSASRHRKRRACRNDQRAIAWKTCAAPDDRAVVDAGEGILRVVAIGRLVGCRRSEEHTSELQSLMRISYAVFCLKKKKRTHSKHAARTWKD